MDMKNEVEEVTCRFAKRTLGVGVTLTTGKIQYEDAEAIACAVDNSLNLAASGSAAISLLSAGGKSLQNECRERFPSGIKHGDVIVLDGCNLKCKKVFLTSLVDCEAEDGEIDLEKKKLLQNMLSAILDTARLEKVKSIAIPAIGIGKMGLSAETVASIYFDCVKRKSPFGSLRNIRFILYSNSVFKEFECHLFSMRDGKGKTILHTACDYRKTKMCHYIVENYPSLINIRSDSGFHILHSTAQSGSVDCLQWMIDRVMPDKDSQLREQYMLNCLTNDGRTILHIACLKGKTNMCQFLVDNYPGLVNVRDNNGFHILHSTAQSGSVECLQRILDIVIPDKGKQHREQFILKCLTKRGSTILHIACLEGKTEMCQYIVDNFPILVNIRNNDGLHILHKTAQSGSVDCLEWISDAVIQDKDMKHKEEFMLKCLTSRGSTILHVACLEGLEEMCQFIVNNYPSLMNIRDNQGWHILHTTAQSGSVDCMERITDIVMPDKDKQHREQYMLKCLTNDGRTILHVACLKKKMKLCQFIVDNYPGLVNIRAKNGLHILHSTARSGSVDLLQQITDIVILEKDQQLREQYILKCLTTDGRTILHVACVWGKTEMCQFIVDNYPGIINIRDINGWHSLHSTAQSGSVDCLEWITDILIPDKDKQHREQFMLKCLTTHGSTILDIACLKGNSTMCQFIVNIYPSLVNIRANNGLHVLHSTAKSGSVDCLERMTDIVIPDKDRQQREQYMLKCLTNDGKTILHSACLEGKAKMCQFIVNNYPGLVNIRNKKGWHSLHSAAHSGSIDCLERITDIVMPDKDKQQIEQFMLNCLTRRGDTIFNIAFLKSNTEMCQFIVNKYPSLVNKFFEYSPLDG